MCSRLHNEVRLLSIQRNCDCSVGVPAHVMELHSQKASTAVIIIGLIIAALAIVPRLQLPSIAVGDREGC